MFRTEKRNLLDKWNRNYDDVFDEEIICVLFAKGGGVGGFQSLNKYKAY